MLMSRFSRTSSPSAEMTRSSIEGGWDWAARVVSNRRVRRESHRRRMFVLRALFSSTSGYMRKEEETLLGWPTYDETFLESAFYRGF